MAYNGGGISEYGSILSGELSEEALIEFCMGGGLRTSRIRSIIWRINLKCLPLAKQEWIPASQQSRMQYFELKKKHITDPRAEVLSQDPRHDDPLSNEERSPWKKYHDDFFLRDIINKDVIRTFPEIPYFKLPVVKEIMADILLTYAKDHPTIGYKQGMHEILAPLIFVLHTDIVNYQTAKKAGDFTLAGAEVMEILEAMYDERFLENDAYSMFCEIMAEIGKWYQDGENELPLAVRKLGEPGPFVRAQDHVPNSPIMQELAAIDQRFYQTDAELASYLRGLDITSQLYGLRWLRLLFGREFPIVDFLYLWDVILADRPIPRICECIFIAMLVQIRDFLLNADYSTCLQWLMRYPPTMDISWLIQLVRHYRNPEKCAKPTGLAITNFPGLTVSGTSHPNAMKPREIVSGFEEPPSGFRPKSRSMMSKVKNFGEIAAVSAGILASPKSSPKKVAFRDGVSPSPQKLPPKMYASPQKKGVVLVESDLQLYEQQVHILQSRLNNRDIVCGEIAKQLDRVADEVTGAESEDARQAIGDKLKQLKERLVGTADSNRDEPPVSISRADPAIEAIMSRPSVNVPRVLKDNEMVEMKNPRR